MVGEGTLGGGNVREAGAVNERNHEIAYRRYDLGSVSRSQPRTIFPEIDIADRRCGSVERPGQHATWSLTCSICWRNCVFSASNWALLARSLASSVSNSATR